jgi:hypothetical protein
MDPHPDFARVELPREAVLPEFRLSRLDAAVLDEDYAAVMETEADLQGFWGDWPSGLTREEDALDLAWHDREFSLKRSFSWVVRDHDSRYLGCLYLFPDPGRRGTAEVVIWARSGPERSVVMAGMLRALSGWLVPQVPDGIALRWRTSPEVATAAEKRP